MKKNPLNMRKCPHEVKKFLQKMRITVLFVLLFCFYAEASSQKVSLKVKNMNLYTVLQQSNRSSHAIRCRLYETG